MRKIKQIEPVLLITGGTGSLGHAIVDKLMDQGSKGSNWEKIIIFSRDERKQEDMYLKFRSRHNGNRLRFFIGDIRDKSRIRAACKDATHVIHAAALKIVPSLEYNPDEAIKTNIMGSLNLLEVAHDHPFMEKLLGVSTDKAVSPTNLYGATKLAMEKLFISANDRNRGFGPLFSCVRYGNVSNSRGSVIPLFSGLAKLGQSLPVTHKDMTRFWITLQEARDFVLGCLGDMQGEEIFIPDMKSYKILDLANLMSDDAVSINMVGVRPGEKIHEELISMHEVPYTHDTDCGFVIRKYVNARTRDFLDEWALPEQAYTSKHYTMSTEDLKNRLVSEGLL